MTKERRKVYDYYFEGQFLFRIGYVHHLKASPPMEHHTHGDMTEFVYLERGRQTYQTPAKNYVVNQGEVFFTLPNEPHDTGTFPEEVSILYYLIVDLHLISCMNLFLFPQEYTYISEFLFQTEQRIYKGTEEVPKALNKLLLCCFDEKKQKLHFDTHVRNALSEALIALATPLESPEKTYSSKIENSLAYIHAHLTDSIRVADLPPMDHLSLSTYNKYFLQAMGMPPGEYVLKKKIEKIKELLETTNLSVTEIAYRYGFSSSQYFTTVFKRFCHVTPTEFRKKLNRNEC